MSYFHGLAGGTPFWETKEVLNESLESLKSILSLGGLYCRSDLLKFGIDIYKKKDNVWNGEDYISICVDDPDEEEFYGENFGFDSSFFRYAKTKVAIEFKPSIVDTCKFREEPYRRLPGERQVYKFIDISNIERIVIGIEGKYEKVAVSEIAKLCIPYNIPVMTFDERDKILREEKYVKALLNQKQN